jgi:hypothetical protein
MKEAPSARREFGTRAGNAVIRRHAPWYWRLALALLVLAFAALAAAWAFHSGKAAGRNETQQALAQADDELRRQSGVVRGLEGLPAENDRLRAQMAALESQVKMHATAQTDLGKSLTELQEENARLKEELAFLRQVTSSASRDEGLSISNFRVERNDFPNQYRYRALLTQSGAGGQEFHGKAELAVSIENQGRASVETYPRSPTRAANLEVRLKRYQRLEGTFQVGDGAVVKGVQLRIYEQGAAEPKLTRTASLDS